MACLFSISFCELNYTLSASELAQASDETWAEKLIPAKAPAECKANV